MSQRIFRVFLSSTFGDFQSEREHLRRDVWPRMEMWCAARGASFQVVDLRWGITEDVGLSHETIKVCLDEIKRCQLLSPRPNFIILLGDRYGWRPAPTSIPANEFELILAYFADNPQARNTLTSWYRQDANAVPAEYILLPRKGEFAESNNAWTQAEASLLLFLREAGLVLGMSPERKKRYLYSATHLEIVNGLLESEDADKHVFAFSREISGLPKSAPSVAAKCFSDYLPDGQLDQEGQQLRLQMLAYIKAVLPESQIHTYSSKWEGLAGVPITLDHLDQFCLDVEASLKLVIGRQLDELETKKDRLVMELEGQAAFIAETGTTLFGRDRELARIVNYAHQIFRKRMAQPLIVHGIGGNGKSALMAKAGENIVREGSGAVVIRRFIGATPRSWVPETFLEDLIRQLAREYGQREPEMPEGGIRKIAVLFKEQLTLATQEKPLILLIDALDQFDSTRPVILTDIFPNEIPDHVCFVLSILDGPSKERLVGNYPKAALLEVKSLGPKACTAILENLLERGDPFTSQRTITAKQKKALLTQAIAIGSPLYVTLLAPLARRLRSWDGVLQMPDSIKGLTELVIKDIARRHGHRILTRTALQYIKLARFGMSEKELQEVLWADPEVREEFERLKNRNQPDVDALPPVIWSRLYAELDPYINEYWMDGQLLHLYFHRVFGEMAGKLDDERKQLLHGRLADYFGQNPLYLDQIPNGRKLMELPYHLSLSGRIDEASALITDFDFAMGKCCLNRSEDWAEDFQRLKENRTEQPTNAFRIWESFIKSNRHILRRGNDDWPAHKILLQLAIEHANDSPATIGAEKFLSEGKCDWPWLRRKSRGKNARIDPCVAVFEGHEDDDLNGVKIFPDEKILSWSINDSVRIWDNEGKPLYVLDKHENRINGPIILPNNMVLTWSSTLLKMWDGYGSQVAVLEGHLNDINGAKIMPDGRILSFSDDSTLRIWSQKGKPLSVLHGHKRGVENAIVLPDSKIVSSSHDCLRIWNSEGQSLATIEGPNISISSFKVLSDGRILTWDMNGNLQLRDEKGQPLSSMEGHTDCLIDVLELSDMRILSCSRDGSLRIWSNDGNIEKVLEGHTGEVSGALELTDDSILSWSFDGTLRLWSKLGEAIVVFNGHNRPIEEAIILPGGVILSWSRDWTLRLWDISGKAISVLDEHKGPITCVKVLSDGRILSGSADKRIILWSPEGDLLTVYSGHTETVIEIEVINVGKFISWSEDKTIRLCLIDENIYNCDVNICRTATLETIAFCSPWLLGSITSNNTLELYDKSGWLLTQIKGHTDRVNGAIQLPDDRIITWSDDNTIRLWNTSSDQLAVFRAHTAPVLKVIELNEGRFLSWALDTTLRLWDENGNLQSTMDGHEYYVQDARILPDGRILSWSRDGSLRLWGIDGNLLKIMNMDRDIRMINGIGVKILPNGNILAWTHEKWSVDNVLKLWANDGSLLANLNRGNNSGIEILPDGRILSWDCAYTGNLRLWSTEGILQNVLEGHTRGITIVKIVPGNRILTCSSDLTIRLWNDEGQALAVMKGHSDEIGGVEVLLNDKILSWSSRESSEKLLFIWSIAGTLLFILKGHTENIESAEILPDGLIASIQSDNKVFIWDLEGKLQKVMYLWEAALQFCTIRDKYYANKSLSKSVYDVSANRILLCSNNQSLPRRHDYVYWNATGCRRGYVFNNSIFATEANNNVSFLQIYQGSKPITVEILESMAH